jgi:hypothetical protein
VVKNTVNAEQAQMQETHQTESAITTRPTFAPEPIIKGVVNQKVSVTRLEDFGIVTYGDQEIRYTPDIYPLKIVEMNTKKIIDTKKHLGEFFVANFGMDETEWFSKELYVVPACILNTNRYMRLAAYNPNSDDNKADCFSLDGEYPDPRSINQFATNCAECDYGDKVWKNYKKTGEKPKCVKGVNVLFFDLDRKIFIKFYFKSTSLGVWNNIYNKIKNLVKTAFIKRAEVSNFALKMTTTDEGIYHKIEMEIVNNEEAGKYKPFIQWFVMNELPIIMTKTKLDEDLKADNVPQVTASSDSDGWVDDKAGAADLPF